LAKSPNTAAALPAGVERGLDAALDRALAIQQNAIVSYVDRLRTRPGATPASVISGLERRYLTAVTAIGAASGGVAAVPGVGTAAALATGAAEIVAFVETSALFALSLAEVHSIRFDDPEVRRALVLAVLLGEAGAASIEAAGVIGSKWAPVLARGVNREGIARVNKTLMTHFATRFGARQGALALGRALPFGVGAGIGAVGNAALARATIRTTRRAFPRPPADFGPLIIDADWTEG
jgi:hypothetical protein